MPDGEWVRVEDTHEAIIDYLQYIRAVSFLKQQKTEKNARDGAERKAEQALLFLEEMELTEDMKEKLIEKVLVYPGNRIEIVWKFKGHLLEGMAGLDWSAAIYRETKVCF